jgi:hypothetical protein
MTTNNANQASKTKVLTKELVLHHLQPAMAMIGNRQIPSSWLAQCQNALANKKVFLVAVL